MARPVIAIIQKEIQSIDPLYFIEWKMEISREPFREYWSNTVDVSQWDEVTVPAELFALGYDVRRNKELFTRNNKISEE